MRRLSIAAALLAVILMASTGNAQSKTCKDTDNGGRLLRVGEAYSVDASWYGPGMKLHEMKDGSWKPLTATGQIFNMHKSFIAHKNLPFYSVVELHNSATNETKVVQVLDDGPHVEGREVDATLGLAEELKFKGSGVVELTMTIVSMPDDKPCRIPKNKREEYS